MKKRILYIWMILTLMLCCSAMVAPELFGVVVKAEAGNKELVKATIGDHLEDNLVYTYRSSEGTYAFSEPDGDYADQVMYDCGSTRVNLMPVGNDFEEFGNNKEKTDTGTYYSILKIQLDENITNLNWDYACLDLTPRYNKVGYNDGFILEAYLVDDYDMNTLTYNNFPQQIEGSPMVEINPGRGNVFEATRCDVTELIKWAVEKNLETINIKFVRSNKSPDAEDCVYLCTERYTDQNYPNTDFTPTLRLLEKPKKLVEATTGDYLNEDLVCTYVASEATYAFKGQDAENTGADLVMNSVGRRVNMMAVGIGWGPKQGDQTNGDHYGIMKVQLDNNIKELNWDYACLDLTQVDTSIAYDGIKLKAYLVGDYNVNTLTYNGYPTKMEGSPEVEINPGGTKFQATRCDVTELIKWAVEKNLTTINIAFERVSGANFILFGTERYTNANHPNSNFAPTLCLLEDHKGLITPVIGDHIEDILVYTYRSSEATYAFKGQDAENTGADLVMNSVGRRVNMMAVGLGWGPKQGDQITGDHYGIMKVQLDNNIKELNWDYACLDLTQVDTSIAYDGIKLKAYLVGDYNVNTLTYNGYPTKMEGSPEVEINPGGTKFQATRCDVTELIKWAVEKNLTTINIAFERVSGQALILFGTERYTNANYPNSNFTPTLRLLKSTKPTKLEIKGGDRTLNPGDVRYLESNGFDAGEGVTATFSSSDSSVVSVTADGVLSATALGEATITLTMGENTATINVNVKEDMTSDDFKLMKHRWLDYLLISASEEYSEVTEEQIKELSDKAEALWNTMYKEGTDRSLLWDMSAARVSALTWYQFRDLNTLASAFLTEGTSLYQNHEVGKAILDALEYMTGTGDYNELDYQWTYDGDISALNGSWWDWQIGASQNFSYILLLMESYLEDEEIIRYTNIINKYAFDPSKQLAITGNFNAAETANLCDIAHSVLIQGLLRNNEGQVRLITASNGVASAMVTKEGYSSFGDGIYKDGSYIAHRTVAYTGHYGNEALNGIALFCNILGGTSYDFQKETIEAYYNYAIEAYLPLLYKGKMMSMVDGRSVAVANQGKGAELSEGKNVMKRLLMLCQNADENYKNIIQGVIKYNLEGMVEFFGQSSLDNEISFLKLLDDDSVHSMTYEQGIKIYGAMCRMVQTTKDYTAGLALTSSHISSYEVVSNTNLTGFYQGAGALYIYNNDLNQFGVSFWPTQDPYRLAGVTADTKPLNFQLSGGQIWPPMVLDNKTAGGASDGKLAAIAYQFSGTNYGLDTKAKKSYFFLENGIVSMGTDISGKTDYTIETTIEARMLNEDGSNKVLINGAVFDGSKQTIHLEAGSWIHMEGNCEGADMAYYFPMAIDIEIEKELRTGSYSMISTTGTTDVYSQWYLNIGINHGFGSVTGGSYLYVTLPGMSVDEIKDYAANNTLEIVDGTVNSGNTLAHFIKNDNGTMMAVNYFGEETYKAEWLTLDPGNGNISVLVTEDEGEYMLSIAEPSFSDAVLSIATDYKMNVVSKSDEITVADDGMSFTVDTTASGAHSFQITFTLEGMSDDEEDSGNTGSGNEGNSGNTDSGNDEGNSGNTDSGNDEGNSGNTDSDSDEEDCDDIDTDSEDGNTESTVAPTSATTVETGDTSPLIAMTIAMCLCGVCLVTFLLYKKLRF